MWEREKREKRGRGDNGTREERQIGKADEKGERRYDMKQHENIGPQVCMVIWSRFAEVEDGGETFTWK